jgi:hypothetical protein
MNGKIEKGGPQKQALCGGVKQIFAWQLIMEWCYWQSFSAHGFTHGNPDQC